MAEKPDPSAPSTSHAAVPQPKSYWEYHVFSRNYADVITALAKNNLSIILADHLKARGKIGEAVHAQATNRGPDVTEYMRVQHLITAIQSKIKDNPQRYHDFIEVLQLEGVRQDAEIALALLPTAPTASPSTDSGSPSDGQGDDYTKQNNMIIRRKFGNLLLKVLTRLQKKLKKSQIKNALRTFILELFPNISPDLIPNSSDLKEIFEAIRRNQLWSFMNYFPLEQIVIQFGDNDPEMTNEIEKFKKDRAGYMLATKIKKHIATANARLCEDEVQLNPINPDYFTRLSLKLKGCVAEHSLSYLEELWQSLSFQMQLPPISLLFQVVLDGSVEVVFLIPTKFVPQAIHQAKYSAHFYIKHQILSVTIGEKDCLFTTEMDKPIDSSVSEPESKEIEKGGYACEFVEPPPAGLETHCTICLQIFHEPNIISCCGNRFCRSCINHIRENKKSCPLCNAPNFDLMHDKHLERSVNDLKVCCIHATSGCTWTGELRQLNEHLNVNPSSEKLLEGCGNSEVKCVHCGHHLQRCQLIQHQVEECPDWPRATYKARAVQGGAGENNGKEKEGKKGGTHTNTGTTKPPTLVELVWFRGQNRRINIAQEISVNYRLFGILLLEDDNGTKTQAITERCRGNLENITMDILQEWVRGKGKQPVIWDTLVDVLRDINLATLAHEIATVKC